MIRFGTLIRKSESALSSLLLFLLALIPVAEMVARVFFKTGIPFSSVITNQLVLFIGMVCAMVTTREKEHLSITLWQFVKSDKVKKGIRTWNSFLSVTILTVFAIASVSFVQLGFTPWKLIGSIPDQILAIIMPIGYTIIALRFIKHSGLSGTARLVPMLGLVAGAFLATQAIAKIIWGFAIPENCQALINGINGSFEILAIPLGILLVLSAFSGTPLFVVLGAIAMIMLQRSGSELEIIPNQAYSMLTGAAMPAIPLFTFVGFILSESKAAERLVRVFKNLFGWLPGGMIVVSILVCAFFTAFTGGSGVTILALGGLLSAILIKKGKYPESFTIGLLTSVGSIGLLFPPSLPIILVGAMTQQNILWMFAGGIVPGIILVASMLAIGVWAAIKYKVPIEPFKLRDTLASIKGAVWELLLPVLVIAGYFSGTFSLVETAGISVLYTLFIEVFITKDIVPGKVPAVVMKAVPIIGGVLIIIASAQALSYYIIDAQIPQALVEWVRSFTTSPMVFLLLLNLALLITGCLMDIYSAILVVLPLIVPLGAAFGIHPIHLGIIFVINMEVGFLTPPVGLNLFLASYRFKRPFLEICKDVLPFLFIQILVVLLVTFVPSLTTGILKFMK